MIQQITPEELYVIITDNDLKNTHYDGEFDEDGTMFCVNAVIESLRNNGYKIQRSYMSAEEAKGFEIDTNKHSMFGMPHDQFISSENSHPSEKSLHEVGILAAIRAHELAIEKLQKKLINLQS